jgi:hypothetical protein
MTNADSDLQKQVIDLKAENELLRKQLADTRAQRAEYMKLITELIPPELPSEDEMREQMKNLIPFDEALKSIREARERRKQNGS